MSEKNRRRHGRVKLRLGIIRAEGAECDGATAPGAGELWTSDISAGGMYFVVPSASAPGRGSMLAFELAVPPGEGYSADGCRLMASGEVVRHVHQGDGTVGLGVKFAVSPTVQP